MGIKKYKYSDQRMLFDIVLLSGIALLLYANLGGHPRVDDSWFFWDVVLPFILVRFIYLSVMYFIPCIAGKTALELDDEKLQLFIRGKLLFQIPRDEARWDEIYDIEFTQPAKGSPIISFTMKDGSVFGFNTKYIAGNDQEIYNTIMKYFKAES